MNTVRTLKNGMLWIERILGCGCAILMVACIFLQTLTRYAFGKPITWTEEIAIILFIWSIYFGAIVAVSRGQHLKVGILVENLPVVWQKIVQIFSDLVFAAVMIVLTFGIQGIIHNLSRFRGMTAILRLPKSVIYWVLPICFVLIVVHLVFDIIECAADIGKAGRGETVATMADPEIEAALAAAKQAAERDETTTGRQS